MDDSPDVILESPYRFLDYYKLEDRDIFFGREAEKRILLADIATTRLVVLFAKTGTGKTSLINAGVRPILEDRQFATFFIRVKKDPVESARREILNLGLNGSENTADHQAGSSRKVSWEGDSFAEQLENVARKLDKKLVLFFDQFEEFFIYPVEERRSENSAEQKLKDLEMKKLRAKRLQFVEDIARLYHNRNSQVHIVLSMREEWFIELDIFRDEIPRIFHNDSNLRLRWFDKDQARDAIKLPVEEYNVAIEDAAVDQLISDLAIDGMIEPAQLQIVCDTLWRETRGDQITLADYQRLGKEASGPGDTIAKKILYHRLEKEFKKIQSDKELYVVYALLPKLRTPMKTKYVRDIDSLVEELTRDDPALREIITDEAERHELIENLKTNGRQVLLDLSEFLEKKLGLIRKSLRDNLTVIELSHDYLVDSLQDLQRSVRTVWARRLLDRIMKDLKSAPESVSLEAFESLTRNVNLLTVSPEEASRMFRFAISSGLYMKTWFDLATEKDRWSILKECITNLRETSQVMDLLGELQSEKGFQLLEGILNNEEIASYAIDFFSFREKPDVVRLLAKALDHDNLIPQALRALRRFEKSEKHLDVAALATKALADFDEANKSVPGATLSVGRVGIDVDVRNQTAFDATSKTLQPDFEMMLKSLRDGRLIPFLGSELDLSGWSKESSPARFAPKHTELARQLAEKFKYPGQLDSQPNLMQISQYVDLLYEREVLYSELREQLDRSFEPNPMAQLLARIATSPAFRLHLVLTTNYDNTLENAFSAAGVPFDVMAADVREGRFRYFPYNDSPRFIDPSEGVRISEERTIFVKLNGSLDATDPAGDSLIVTEDDHIEQLLRDISSLLPVKLAARLRRSYFLFLGYSLRSWNLRVLLRRLWGEQRSSLQSWCVNSHPLRFDEELWQSRGVKIINVSPIEYVTTLQRYIEPYFNDQLVSKN